MDQWVATAKLLMYTRKQALRRLFLSIKHLGFTAMDLLKRYKRNDDAIKHGAKMDLGGGSYVLLARMHESNPQFKAVTEALSRKRQHELDNLKGRDKTDAYGDIAEEAFAQVCITQFTNVSLGDDAIQADATGIARVRSEAPEFWGDMMTFAMDKTNYVGSFDEDASVKN